MHQTRSEMLSRSINNLNRVASVSLGNPPDVVATAFGFDANGQTIGSSDGLGQGNAQTLDALRRPVASTLPDGSQARVAYNALDQITSATDPKGIRTSYVKNAWGETLSETSPDSGLTTYTRDAAGNVLTMLDARGQSTRYSYDALNRLAQVTRADGQLHRYSYDTVGTATSSLTVSGPQTGTLRSVVDTSGTTTYSRDALGRITQKVQTVQTGSTSTLPTPKTLTTKYSYTSAGDLASIVYPSGLTAFYSRNSTGQITGISTKLPGTGQTTKPFVTAITSNALGLPSSWQWNHCTTPVAGTTTTVPSAVCTSASRRYDSAGRMAANELASYRYDAASRITGITQLLQAQTVTSSVVPNPSGTGTTTISTTRYQPTTLTWTASYDSRDRLTALVRSNTSSRYQYDANSNRLTSVAQTIADTNGNATFEALDTAANTAQALAVDATSNRLLGFTQSITSVRGTQTLSTVNSAVNYSLDAAGNLASDGLRAFAYDATNRHTSTRYAAGADTATVQYLFNALGQRVFKSVVSLSSGTGVVSGGANTATGSLTPMPTLGQFYSYADDSDAGGSGSSASLPSYALLGEYCNGASGCVQQEYLWLPLDNGQAIPVGMLRSSRLYAIHTDHLGTPRLIHDDSNTPVWQWAYSAFGENAPSGALKATTNVNAVFALGANNAKLAVSAPAVTVNLRFAGQYFDSESNLYQNYLRSYQAGQGRYSQADPIGLKGGMNRFGYVGGNAFSKIDPFGLDAEVGVRVFHPVPLRYVRHCFIRFNGNNNDTLSFTNKGVAPDPNPGGTTILDPTIKTEFSTTSGPENDDCVRKEMNSCQGDDYNFTGYNCCMCASNALAACGLKKDGPWPNWPRDASNPPYIPSNEK
jgi:RHS repeat-associated protein